MTQLEKNEERYLSTQEIADLLSCKVATVRRWASAGGVEGVDFPEVAVVVGGVRGWERSAVLKFGTEVARIRRRRRPRHHAQPSQVVRQLPQHLGCERGRPDSPQPAGAARGRGGQQLRRGRHGRRRAARRQPYGPRRTVHCGDGPVGRGEGPPEAPFIQT